ncbi:MAG: FkbM family methyltransferase [Bacteroidetes bacterium]|nr:FkbM family methyltransferase [Bacteroidota bacterium]
MFSWEDESIVFDTLNNIVAEYKLPIPNYIKADIEGEELNFLNSSVSFIKKNKPELIQITTYHRPTDHITIPNYFSSFEGNGSFSDGVMVFNRDGMVNGSYRKKIYHPIIRKCLYSFRFNH